MKNIFNKITNWTNRIEIVNISISTVVLLLLLTFIGVVFIAIPKVVNEKADPDLPSDAVNIAAMFRAANGGFGFALGMVAIYSRNLPSEYASTVLLSLGTGILIVNLSLISGKIREFGELPIPPMILLLTLTFLAYYAALF